MTLLVIALCALCAILIGGAGFALGVAEGTRDTERRWADAVSRADWQRKYDASRAEWTPAATPPETTTQETKP